MALTQVKGSILSDELYRRENNLSDVPDKAKARSNLGIYSTTDSDNRYLNESNNLSDLNNKSTARANLDVYSKREINNKIDARRPSIWIGEIRRFSFDTPPAGFFALDGSWIPNGKNDFPALAKSGSRFITISGNNLILVNFQDFGRGKGSSGRRVGSFEGDAIRNLFGEIHGSNTWGCFGGTTPKATGVFNAYKKGRSMGVVGINNTQFNLDFDVSRTVPTAPENRPKSLTELVCIYHGVL